jgi:serine/threonine protein kinase
MVAGQKYDYKSDLWALGCTVYEMCALRPAFVFNASFQVMGERISSANYSPIPSAYSKELAELIKVMLKPDPKRRPTAYQLLSSTALEKDLNIYMDFVKSLPSNGSGSSSQISDSSSDSAGATRKSSCSSMGSGDLAASSSDGSQVSKNQPPG